MARLSREVKEEILPTAALARRIRVLRKARNLTQFRLMAPELSKSFLSLVESGRSHLSPPSLALIARRLRVSVAMLYGESRTANSVIDELETLLSERRTTRRTTDKSAIDFLIKSRLQVIDKITLSVKQ